MAREHWFYTAVDRSFLAAQKKREEEAATSDPALRGGNAGALIDGTYYGACPRVSALRYEGLDIPVDMPWNTYRQFAGGLANEDIIYEQLLGHGIPADRIRREEEIPVRWTTDAGIPVTGRPDICIMSDEDPEKVSTLFELKTVVSLWTAKGVHYELVPKSDHLIQAAHYSMIHEAKETLLVYSSRAQFHLSTAPGWLRSKFEPGTHDVQFKDDGTPMKIMAFDRVYQLAWDGEFLTYYTEGLDAPQRTALTKDSIRAYYESVARSLQDNVQLPRPGKKSVDGSKDFLKCQYCPLSDVCDRHENESRSTWKDHVSVEIDQLKKESAL